MVTNKGEMIVDTKVVFLNEDMSVIDTHMVCYVGDVDVHVAAGLIIRHHIPAVYVEVQVLGTGKTVSIWEVKRTLTHPDTHINDMAYTHGDHAQYCDYVGYGKHMPTVRLTKVA